MTILKSFDNLEYSEAFESSKEAQEWLEKNSRRFGQLINGQFVSNKDSDLIASLDPSNCLLYTSPSPRDLSTSRMPSSA